MTADAARALAQPTPFLQRFVLLKTLGEPTKDAALLARYYEHLGPLDQHEADTIAASWHEGAA